MLFERLRASEAAHQNHSQLASIYLENTALKVEIPQLLRDFSENFKVSQYK